MYHYSIYLNIFGLLNIILNYSKSFVTFENNSLMCHANILYFFSSYNFYRYYTLVTKDIVHDITDEYDQQHRNLLRRKIN